MYYSNNFNNHVQWHGNDLPKILYWKQKSGTKKKDLRCVVGAIIRISGNGFISGQKKLKSLNFSGSH